MKLDRCCLRVATAIVVVICGFLLLGCPARRGPDDGDQQTGSEDFQAEMFDTTLELGDDALSALQAVEADGSLRFNGTPAELSTVAYKSVLLAGISEQTPQGFIRMVTETEQINGDLVLHTVPVPIQFAFRKLDLSITGDLSELGYTDSSGMKVRPTAKRGREGKVLWTDLPLNMFAFNGDNDPNTLDDQVHITGHLSGGVDYTFGINVNWADVLHIPDALADCAKSLFTSCSIEDLMPEAKIGFSLVGGVNAELDMQGVSFLPYSKKIPIDHRIYDPIVIGPLVFFPELDVSAEIGGAASSEFSLSSSIDLSAGAGVDYSNKTGPNVTPPHVDAFDIQAPTVDAKLDAYTKVRLGPKLALKLYGVAGPYAAVYGFVELNADILESPCWTLDGGVEGELGFEIRVDIPLFGPIEIGDWHEQLDIWDTSASSGSCTGTVDDALIDYQQPSFAPWSKAYTDTVKGTGLPLSGPGGGMVWTDIQQTVDGGFAVVGSGGSAMLMVDGAGEVRSAMQLDGPTLDAFLLDHPLPDRVVPTLDGGWFVSAFPWTLLRLDLDGSILWARQFQSTPNKQWWRVGDMIADGDGGFYFVAGYGTDPIQPIDVDALVVRMSEDAGILWSHRVGDAGIGEVPRVIVPFDNGIIVLGSKWDTDHPGRWRMWAARIAADGTVIWTKEYPVVACNATSETSIHPLVGHEADDGDLVFGGIVDSSPERSCFGKLKPDGTIAFLTSYKEVNSLNLEDLRLTSLQPLATSGYIAAGTYMPYPYDLDEDLWIGQLDGVGQFQWVKRLKSPDFSSELMPAVHYTEDGGILVAGYTETLAGGSSGFWLTKAFAKDGTITFPGSSGVTVESLHIIQEAHCPTAQDWNVLTQPMNLEFQPIEEHILPASPTVTQLAP